MVCHQSVRSMPAWVAKGGQKLIVCEGYAALAHRVLGGLRRNGQPMFTVTALTRNGFRGHIVAVARPTGPGSVIVTNNNETMLYPPQRSDAFIVQRLFGKPTEAVWFGSGKDEQAADRASYDGELNEQLGPDARVVRLDGRVRRADQADRDAYAAWSALIGATVVDFGDAWERTRDGGR